MRSLVANTARGDGTAFAKGTVRTLASVAVLINKVYDAGHSLKRLNHGEPVFDLPGPVPEATPRQ
jgi:hypothetical protein